MTWTVTLGIDGRVVGEEMYVSARTSLSLKLELLERQRVVDH